MWGIVICMFIPCNTPTFTSNLLWIPVVLSPIESQTLPFHFPPCAPCLPTDPFEIGALIPIWSAVTLKLYPTFFRKISECGYFHPLTKLSLWYHMYYYSGEPHV